MTVSPDGEHVYVASFTSDAVAAFARNKTTGALTQLPGLAACVSEDGSAGDCGNGAGLNGARGVAVSKDGRHVYVVSELGDAIVALERAP